MTVNGLPIPAELVVAIDSWRWPVWPTSDRLQEVFGDDPAGPLLLYQLNSIRAINLRWREEQRAVYIGHPSDEGPPGDIDPAQSLLIGDLGPGQRISGTGH
jgi:hypothetical protein